MLFRSVGSRAARSGESITLFGVGFDASAATSVTIGTVAARVTYAGLSGSPGLYQINFTVPNLPDGDYPLVVSSGSIATEQSLSLSIRN